MKVKEQGILLSLSIGAALAILPEQASAQYYASIMTGLQHSAIAQSRQLYSPYVLGLREQ